VSVVFGLPGDENAHIMDALRRCQDKIRFVLVRHEQGAAFMASGYAKHTGKLGVCVSTGQVQEQYTCSMGFMTQSSMGLRSCHHRRAASGLIIKRL
jgi:glyoxylate carboligase